MQSLLDGAFKVAAVGLLIWNGMVIHATNDTADQARRHAIAAEQNAAACGRP